MTSTVLAAGNSPASTVNLLLWIVVPYVALAVFVGGASPAARCPWLSLMRSPGTGTGRAGRRAARDRWRRRWCGGPRTSRRSSVRYFRAPARSAWPGRGFLIARRSLAAETIFMALVICCVFLTLRIRRRMSIVFAIGYVATTSARSFT